MNLKGISDKQLYVMCQNYGRTALEARNKFIGLLPEVNNRKLYAEKFVSIFHFAAVIAGVSREQVHRALHVFHKFENMPHLLELLVNGVVSVNKLRRVLPIVAIENEAELAQLVQTLSKSALETFVRDVLIQQARDQELLPLQTEIKDGLFEPQNKDNYGPGPVEVKATKELPIMQPFEYVGNPPLNNEIKKKLNELAEKGININELIEAALKQRETEIAQEKMHLAEKAEQKLIEQIVEGKNISRAAPIAIKKLFKKEFGNKCSKPFCRQEAQAIHHTNRFALSDIHDPLYMAPLCKNHHQIAHKIDVKSTEKWNRR